MPSRWRTSTIGRKFRSSRYASFNLDLSDSEEDNGGKRVAPAVSRFPEAPVQAGPRGPLRTSRTLQHTPKNKSPPACKTEGHVSSAPFLPAQVLSGRQNTRVFWLPLLPTLRAFPEHCSSGSRADFVRGHSCGAATVFHRLPLGILCISCWLFCRPHLTECFPRSQVFSGASGIRPVTG